MVLNPVGTKTSFLYLSSTYSQRGYGEEEIRGGSRIFLRRGAPLI